MNYTYGPNVQAAMDDPNGMPGQTRGGVEPTISRPPVTNTERVGHGPSPYPQNASVPDPLALTTEYAAVGPEG